MRPVGNRCAGVLAIGVVLVAAGCVNRHITVPMPTVAAPRPSGSPTTAPGPFDYDREPIPLSNHDLTPKGQYEVKLLSFPSVGKNGQDGNLVTARYYKAWGPDPKKLVIILPIWGSPHVYPAKKMSRVVRSRSDGDAHVLMILGENRIVDFDEIGAAENVEAFRSALAEMAERCRASIVDVRRFIDWAETQPEIDPDRIAVVGLSIGALIAADVALVEPRISVTVMAMGGAGPAEIFGRATAGTTAAAREAILERFDWTVERYEAEVDAQFDFLDASRIDGQVDPRKVLVLDAQYDQRMPAVSRDALWRAMGRPQRISLLYAHNYSFLSMTPLGGSFTSDRIWEFLEATL